MTRKTPSLTPISWIGLAAGTLDITENLVFNSFRAITPWRVFQYIASGLIGTRAFQIGWTSIFLGVFIHYAIAFSWTTIYYVAAIRCNVTVLTRRPVLSGLIFGLVVYSVMNFIVLPLSGVPHPRAAITLASRINAVLALLFCIGLPVSLLTAFVRETKRS
jgi:hypothetical protein